MKVALTIAGSDSGGGAGIQADLKTFAAHGVFGTTAITSITAQNTRGVYDIFDLPVSIINGQIQAVLDDFEVAAIKIGMLSSREIIGAVTDILQQYGRGIPIVLDPVMISTSGHALLSEDAIDTLKEQLLPLAALVTPNANEAAALTGIEVATLQEMEAAAMRIQSYGATAVLVKGGHVDISEGNTRYAVDVLCTNTRCTHYGNVYLETTSTHGTGCTLSSAITANIASGMPLESAVANAKEYVHNAIANAPGIGAGSGPLFHNVGPSTAKT